MTKKREYIIKHAKEEGGGNLRVIAEVITELATKHTEQREEKKNWKKEQISILVPVEDIPGVKEFDLESIVPFLLGQIKTAYKNQTAVKEKWKTLEGKKTTENIN